MYRIHRQMARPDSGASFGEVGGIHVQKFAPLFSLVASMFALSATTQQGTAASLARSKPMWTRRFADFTGTFPAGKILPDGLPEF
jgi:hypothetical protein